jgi:hypothetical protein
VTEAEQIQEFFRCLVLREAARLDRIEDTVRGIDIERKGVYANADRALVAKFIASRGEPSRAHGGALRHPWGW